MKLNSKTACVSLAVAALAVTALNGRAQSASATISDVPSAGNFLYTITLHNTGTFPLNSFWYGWTQAGNNLPTVPSGLSNLSGWANNPSGNSIEWVNSTGTPLAPGGFATFSFLSSSSPTAITTLPSGDSVAYVHGITFSQGAAGDSTGIFAPQLVPEPSSLSLIGLGAMGVFSTLRRKIFGK